MGQHLAVLKTHSLIFAQGSLLVVLRGSYGVLRIQLRITECKTSAYQLYSLCGSRKP